MAKAAQRGRQ